MAITGYNMPHITEASYIEGQALANHLPKGLTQRMYAGEESRYYTITEADISFLKTSQAKVILVYTNGNQDDYNQSYAALTANGIPVTAVEFENERFIFDPPTIWTNFIQWQKYTFQRDKYFRDLATVHLNDLKNFIASGLAGGKPVYYCLPLKVTENTSYRAYAEMFLNSDIAFMIDLHIFGGEAGKLRAQMQWYKDKGKGRKIGILEFNGLNNTREDSFQRNTQYHRNQHNALLNVAKDFAPEILYFTMVANAKTQGWRNPSFLHKYYVNGSTVTNEINDVWA